MKASNSKLYLQQLNGHADYVRSNFVDAHINMILPYLKLGQHDNAVDHARQAYDLDPMAFQIGYDLSATLIVVGPVICPKLLTSDLQSTGINDL